MPHRNNALSQEGRRRLVARCRTRPIAHVAAEAAVSRQCLGDWVAHVNARHRVPERAILLVAAVTLVLGLFFVGQIGLITSLVNFGALTSFMLLHVAVVVNFGLRRRSRNVFLHWISPAIGFVVIGFVLVNAEPAAKIGGLAWLVIGIAVMTYYRRRGIGSLPEHRADPTSQETT